MIPEGRVTFIYRFASEDRPPLPLKLKVEMNTREHFAVDGLTKIPFEIESRWFSGACGINSYHLNELLGTKLRALYQRRKGRDLFDLAVALEHPVADANRIIEVFSRYMDHGGHAVTRQQFLENLAAKLEDKAFTADIGPLLATGYSWDINAAATLVRAELIERLD